MGAKAESTFYVFVHLVHRTLFLCLVGLRFGLVRENDLTACKFYQFICVLEICTALCMLAGL